METDEALRLAGSQSWSDRARAASHLSTAVGREPVDDVVRSLLLDHGNTGVTDAAAGALLRRRDATGLPLFAAAWHVAEPEQADHLTSRWSAVLFELACAGPDGRRHFRAVLQSLLDDADPNARAGAQDLLDRAARALPD